MHQLFSAPPRRFTGAHSFPEMAYLRRSFTRLLDDVQSYYRRYPKYVDSQQKLANVLVHIPQRWDLDDRRYVRFVEDTARGVLRVFGFTDPTHRGKVHEGGVTLGPKTDEIILSTLKDFDVSRASRQWREWKPFEYLYHTRTDLGLPILNNQSPGKGWGVGVINIPMLALQYRYWLRQQSDRGSDQKDTVYRFVGSFVLPNALESYLDIAVFNRLARLSRGIGTSRFPTPHPFYLTDFSQRIDALCSKILETQERRSGDIEQVPYTTPMVVKESLYEVMQLPNDPISRQNEWALQLARLPYVRYIVETAVHAHRGDRHYLNDIHETLVDASYDRIFTGIGSPRVVQHYRGEMRSLLSLLNEKGHGWS